MSCRHIRLHLVIPVLGVEVEKPLTKPLKFVRWQMCDRSLKFFKSHDGIPRRLVVDTRINKNGLNRDSNVIADLEKMYPLPYRIVGSSISIAHD